jgi:hypothetical protein
MIIHLKIDWHCQRWDPQTKLSKRLHWNSHDIMSQKNAPEVLRKIGTKEKALKSKRNKYYRDTSWPMCACKSFTRLPSKMFQEQNQNSKISVRKKAYSSFLFSLSRSMCILRFGKQAAFYLDHVHGLNDTSCAHARQSSVQKRLDSTPHRYWHLCLFWTGRHLGLSHVLLFFSLSSPQHTATSLPVWIVCRLVRSL